MKMANETKIGILVVICLVSLGVLTIKVGNFTFYKKRYTVNLSFQNAGGIKLHAPVRISGVEVGEITEIQPPTEKNNYQVILLIALDEGIKIRKDANIYITMMGLMGENYIEITAGTAGSDFVQPGETVVGKSPIVMAELFENVESGMDNVQKLIGNINDVVMGNRDHLDNIFVNLDSATTNLDEFTADLKGHPWKLFYRPPPERK